MAAIKRPDLPKALAARIRAAQAKVSDKRLAIIAGDRRIKNATERVSLYDSSPYAYAAEYYRGMDIDSYPVQTRIARDREELAYYSRRAPERIIELAQAEAHLAQVEDEVLLKVLAMRPSTGRVPWPRRLKSFEVERHATELAWARSDEQAKARHARVMARLNADVERADNAMRASIGALVDSIAAHIDKMPKAKQDATRAAIAEHLERLRTGEIGAFEFLGAFGG